MAKTSSSPLKGKGLLCIGIVAVAVIAIVVALVVVVTKSKKGPKKAAGKAKAAAAASRPKAKKAASSRAGAASPSANSASAYSASASTGGAAMAFSAHPKYLVSGETANSDAPMPEQRAVPGMIHRSMQGEGPQNDAKAASRATLNLYDGTGVQFTPEMLSRVKSAADLEALIRSDPMLAEQFQQELQVASTPGDKVGIKRARPDQHEAAELQALVIDVPVTQQSHFVGRSGRPSAVTPERFASAVGPSNLAHLAASRSQYDSLIAHTLVEPEDRAKQAAMISLIQKRVTDPAARAKLMVMLNSLTSAVFKDSESAQQALQNGGTGYIGFTDRLDSRGTTGSIAARYSAGDGGDLAPLIFNYPPITTVNRERLQACGYASHQAHEFAAGRDFGGLQ